MRSGMYWHAYHWLYLLFWVEDYDERIETIQTEKPKHEREDRLRWFKKVEGKLPTELVEAGKARAKAYQAWLEVNLANDETAEISREAGKAYRKICRKHQPAIEKLHAKECPDCSWEGMRLVFNKR